LICINRHFIVNHQNIFQDIQAGFHKLSHKPLNYEESQDFTVMGENYIVIWTDKGLHSFRFDTVTNRLTEFKKIKHKPLEYYKGISLHRISTTCHPDYFLIFYMFSDTENIIIWDIKNNKEYNHFSTRKGDQFLFYCHGGQNHYTGDEEIANRAFGYSELGYLVFNKYFVDMDNMIPNPFIQAKDKDLAENYWSMGQRMSQCGNYVIINGNLLTLYSYLDIFFRSEITESKSNSLASCMYFINKSSIISDFQDDLDKLRKVLSLLRENPIYYTAILLPGENGESPMVRAISKYHNYTLK
jgi:hypothetical protein